MGKSYTTEEIADKITEKHPGIEVIGNFKCMQDRAVVRCKKCGHTWNAVASVLMTGRGCRKCFYTKLHKQALSFTTDEFKSYIDNHFPDFEIIGEYKTLKDYIRVRCKTCGAEFNTRPQECVGKNGHLKCKACSDGISYPNKFARALLTQLPVCNSTPEWYPEWANVNGKRYYYDNYFEYNGCGYVLEMDGSFHYIDNPLTGKPLADSIATDRIKDSLAKRHGVCVIRIDSRESNMDYLRSKLVSSKLGTILDLSAVDWMKCETNARENTVKQVCKYYMEVNKDTKNISDHFMLARHTVRRYLKIGTSIGICDYKPNKYTFIDTYAPDGALVLSNQYIMQTVRKLQDIGIIGITRKKIDAVLQNKAKDYMGYTFVRTGTNKR